MTRLEEIERRALLFYGISGKQTMAAWHAAVKRAKAGEQPSEFELWLDLKMQRERAIASMKLKG